jgi:PmbA protein
MKNVMEKVLNQVVDKNAEADLMFSSSRSLKMSSEKGAISTYNVAGTQILGIRVIKDGRVGLSYTESMDEESLALMVSKALQNAETTVQNPDEKILNISGSITDELSMPETEVDLAVKTARAIELETEVRKLDSRVTSVPYNSYSEQDYLSHYLSTKGRFTTYKDKSYSIVSSAVMDEKGKKSSYYDYHTAHVFKDLKFKKVIDTAFFHAKNLLEEKTLPSGKYNVRFTEDSLKGLIDCFSNFYSAKSAMDKMNPWASHLGEEVISKDLTITDHPTFDRSFRTSKFDSEGVERKPLELIKDGVLKSLYHNSVTATHFKTQTTGHAARSATSPLGVYGTDLLIQGKNTKPLPDKYLEVIQMDGLYSGANRVTGAFSVAIKGYVWEHGQRVSTFGNITMSGKLMDLLKNVEVVGSEMIASTDESFFSVPLIFHGVSVAGT